jgi:hypothetical protein
MRRQISDTGWLAIELKSTDGKAYLVQRKDDAKTTNLAVSGSALSLSSGTWYSSKRMLGHGRARPYGGTTASGSPGERRSPAGRHRSFVRCRALRRPAIRATGRLRNKRSRCLPV